MASRPDLSLQKQTTQERSQPTHFPSAGSAPHPASRPFSRRSGRLCARSLRHKLSSKLSTPRLHTWPHLCVDQEQLRSPQARPGRGSGAQALRPEHTSAKAAAPFPEHRSSPSAPRSVQARPSSRPWSRPWASTSLCAFSREISGPCAGSPRRGPRAAHLVLGRLTLSSGCACVGDTYSSGLATVPCRPPEQVLCAGPWAGAWTRSKQASYDDDKESKTVLVLLLLLSTAGRQQSHLPVTPQGSSMLGRCSQGERIED